MQQLLTIAQNILSAGRCFQQILTTINRRNELRRLAAWASLKRLTPQQKYYQRCVEAEEVRLVRHAITHRYLTRVAYAVVALRQSLFPPPRYHRRGVARVYTRAQHTH